MNLQSLFGRFLGGGNAFAETLDGSIDRANVRFLLPSDSALYLTQRSRSGINEKVEWIWQNFGAVKEIGSGTARHTVGKGISLQIDSEDDEWNELAEDDFEDYALTAERCDLAGRRNFYEQQTTGIEQRIYRGEFLWSKTFNPLWGNEPCNQLYDTEEIVSPPLDHAGLEEGATVIDGCQLDRNSRVTIYWVKGLDGSYTPISRAQMGHWFKPHAINQVRGISDLAQAVNSLVDIHELKRLTTRSAKAQQLIALVLKGVGKRKTRGALGAIKNQGVKTDGTPDADTAQLEQLVGAAGAGICYIDDPTGDAKLITPNSPTPLVEGFITDLLMRDVYLAPGVPAEFFWSIGKLGGANTRFVLSKADLLFQTLGDGLIYRFCTPTAYRYLKHRVDTGKLRACKDRYWASKLSWQTPPRVTTDNGNEGNLQIELLAAGLITLRQYCNARGLNYRHEMRQWIREPIEFIRIATQELKDSKLTEEIKTRLLDRWSSNMPLWRAAKPGTETGNGQAPEGQDGKTTKPADPNDPAKDE